MARYGDVAIRTALFDTNEGAPPLSVLRRQVVCGVSLAVREVGVLETEARGNPRLSETGRCFICRKNRKLPKLRSIRSSLRTAWIVEVQLRIRLSRTVRSADTDRRLLPVRSAKR